MAGDRVDIQTPHGLVEVEVPEGCQPGDRIDINMPTAPETMAKEEVSKGAGEGDAAADADFGETGSSSAGVTAAADESIGPPSTPAPLRRQSSSSVGAQAHTLKRLESREPKSLARQDSISQRGGGTPGAHDPYAAGIERPESPPPPPVLEGQSWEGTVLPAVRASSFERPSSTLLHPLYILLQHQPLPAPSSLHPLAAPASPATTPPTPSSAAHPSHLNSAAAGRSSSGWQMVDQTSSPSAAVP